MLAYLAVTLAGITHRDLLLNNPTQLPFVNVRIPLTGFFFFGPLVLVFFHFGLLLQHAHLHKKLLAFNEALGRAGGPCSADSGDIRDELHSYFLAQAVAGKAEDRSLAFADRLMTTVTFSLAPVFLLLYFQVRFLPYHDEAFTWAHRVYVFADVVVVLTIGGFLSAMRRAWREAWPKQHGFRRWAGQAWIWIAGTPPVLMTATALVSLFAATLPHEAINVLIERTTLPPWSLLERLGAVRNLDVSDLDLIPDKGIVEGEATLILRGRDFRKADFSRSDLKQADFHGADLAGASLEGTNLNGAELGLTRFQGANLTSAKLQGANLESAELQGANLKSAELLGANLRSAKLQGANLASAELQGADLMSAELQGANLGSAKLQGADLGFAQLQGANLGSSLKQPQDEEGILGPAMLQGADLGYAELQGAHLGYVQFQGANLWSTQLQGANLGSAALQGADLREAGIWRTMPTGNDQLDLVDFSALSLQAPTQKQQEKFADQLRKLQSLAQKMEEEKTPGQSSVAEAARKFEKIYQEIYQKNDGTAWSEKKDEFCVWRRWRGQPAPDQVKLAQYLGDLACEDESDKAYIAEMFARRFADRYWLIQSERRYQPSMLAGAEDFLKKLASCPAVKDKIHADVMKVLQQTAKQLPDSGVPLAQPQVKANVDGTPVADADKICADK